MALKKPNKTETETAAETETVTEKGTEKTKPPNANQGKEVTTTTKSEELAAANAGITAFMDNAESQGFEGMELDRSSFTAIVLDTAEFIDANTEEALEIDETDMSKKFRFIPLNSRKKFIHKFLAPGADNKDAEIYVCYSDDPTTHTNENIDEVKALKDEDGLDHSVGQYLESVVMVVAKDATNDADVLTLALLSIPPTSRAKMSGAIGTYNAKNRKDPIKSITTAILDASVGPKKRNKSGDTYHPWNFNCIGKLG